MSSDTAQAHVVQIPTPPFLTASGRWRVHQVPAATDNLIWVLECTASQRCAIVDGPDADGVLRYIEAHGLTLTTILNTHTHPDHIGLNRDLAKRGRLSELRVVGAAETAERIPGLTEAVGDGDRVTFGPGAGQVLATPGHVDGHISFLFDDALFCGDTLFAGGCGYLFDGPPARMHASLRRLAALPADTRVCCAHEYTQDNLRFAWSVEPGNPALAERIREVWAARTRGEATVPSTIAIERATNPFLRQSSAELRAAVERARPSAGPAADPAAVFAATRALKDRGDYKTHPEPDIARLP